MTRSTKGGGCPEITRKFVDGDRTLNEDEELKTDDFFKKSPLFERLIIYPVKNPSDSINLDSIYTRNSPH